MATIKSGDGNEGCSITIQNNSGYQMTLNSQSADHGYFTQGPPTNIASGGSTDVQAQGTDGTATGCKISFTYQLADANTTTVSWAYEKPYDGENSYSVSASGQSAGNYSITTSPPYSPSDNDWLTTTTTIALGS